MISNFEAQNFSCPNFTAPSQSSGGAGQVNFDIKNAFNTVIAISLSFWRSVFFRLPTSNAFKHGALPKVPCLVRVFIMVFNRFHTLILASNEVAL